MRTSAKRKTKQPISPAPIEASTVASADASVNPLVRTPGVGRGVGAHGAFPEFSRTELARKLGVHKSTISNLLAGRRDLSEANALVLAAAMGIGVEEFHAEVARQRAENGIAPQRKKRGLKLVD